MSEKVNSIVVQTEDLNRNGVIIYTDGLNVSNFKNNPIMLLNHNKDKVIGTWKDLKFSDKTIIATPVFAQNDLGKETKTLYTDKIIKSSSIGVAVEDGYYKNEVLHITKSDLAEISLVSVPANPNTLQLHLHNKGDIKNILNNKQNKTKGMEKENKGWLHAFGAKLGLGADKTSELSVNDKITEVTSENSTLKSENETLKSKIVKLEAEIAKENKVKATVLVENALKDGKITADKKDEYIKLATSNYELVKELLENKEGKTKINSGIKKEKGISSTSYAQMYKENPKELFKLSQEQPELYKQMLEESNLPHLDKNNLKYGK